jgi:hypothetical protein
MKTALIKSRTKTYRAIIVSIAFSGLVSCQKVINIDLNSSSPQLVVEATISNNPGPYYVRLSKSVNFDNITTIPGVPGAIVEISDSSGNRERLTELTGGMYKTRSFQGAPGQTYKLTINTGGQVYESVSRMPYPVEAPIFSIAREADDRPSPGGESQAIHYRVNFEIKDPAEYSNYYHFIVYHKNLETSSFRAFSDQYHNGRIIADEFRLQDTLHLVAGDTIMIELQNIDRGTYNFYRTLRDGLGGFGFLSASPSNPISNISNNGLGYFSAYSVNIGFSVVPE